MPETFKQRRERELRNSVIFDQVERQVEEGRARAASLTSTHPADVAADLKKRATDLKISYEAAAILGDDAVRELRARSAVDAVTRQPSLGATLGDPYLSTIADGDHGEMARLAGAARKPREKPSFSETLSYIVFGDTFLSEDRKKQIQEERGEFYKGAKDVLALAPAVTAQGAKETLYNTAAGSITQVTERYTKLLQSVGLQDTDAEYGALALRFLAAAETRKSDALVPEDMNLVQKGALSGFRSLPGAGAGVAAAALGGPAAGAAVLGIQSNSASYLEGRASGLSVDDAGSYAATNAGLEYVSEYLPFVRLFGDAKVGSTLGKRLIRNLVDEQLGEQFATASQDLNAWASLPENQDKPFTDYLSERPDAAVQTAIATLVASGVTNVAVGAVGATDALVRKAGRVRSGAQDAETLDTIMDSATKHKMRERDPDAFAQYVSQQTEGTPTENVYIAVEAVDTLFQSEIMDEDTQVFFEKYAEQIAEARLTGGDVVIPTSEIAARLAGTPVWEALKPDARIDAGGFSPRQIETEQKGAERTLEQRGEEIANAALDEIEADAPRAAVFEDVKVQLVAAGFTEDAANKQALLYAANRQAVGARYGMTALEYHQANPVEFQNAELGAAAAGATRVMDQDTDAFKSWFDGSKVVDTEGKPLRVFHATDKVFDKFNASGVGKGSALGMPYETARTGVFMAVDPKLANDFTLRDGRVKQGANVRPAYLNLKNPFDMRDDNISRMLGTEEGDAWEKATGLSLTGLYNQPQNERWENFDGDEGADMVERLVDAGYDGAIILEDPAESGSEDTTTYVVFNPDSIRSSITLEQASRYDERFGDQPLTAADRFGDPATLLEHDDWAILTAENPRGEQADEVTNARAMRDLEADLQAMGLVYTPAVGKYGQIENSFAVVGIAQAEADMLGRKYDQDSVLTRAGLTYQDGSVNGVTGAVDVFTERPDDFFTEVPALGVSFAIGIDFDHTIAPVGETTTAGWTEKRVDDLIAGATENSYAVMMTPDDFLGLTLSAKGRKVVEQRVSELPEYGELDVGKLAEKGPIVLGVKPSPEPSEYQKARGLTTLPALTMSHDGRHRAMMLKRAGVSFMPVAIRADGPLAKGIVLTPQRSRSDQLAMGDTPYTFGDLVEVKPENREALLALGSPARVLFQSENPAFYSALARAIENSKQAKAPASQWKGILVNAPGVKPEELEWSGLLETLDFDPKAVFTREELAAVVEAGGIKIEERMLSTKALLEDVEAFRDDEMFEGMSDDEIRDQLGTDGRDNSDAPQFSNWTSDTDNDTYRELLLTLPIGQGGNPERAPPTHWDQPAVVAHVRFMDKEDVDGKLVLFVEEVQSDWHQKGRDQGYEKLVDGAEVEALREKYVDATDAWYAVMDEFTASPAGELIAPLTADRDWDGSTDRFLRGERAIVQRIVTGDIGGAEGVRSAFGPFENYLVWKQKYQDARNAYHLVGRELDIAKGLITNGGIPNAPFKTSWPALVMKRVIKYAVDGGYDKVAWTTGQQQAERYNLSEAVGALTFDGMQDGEGYRVALGARAGDTLLGQGIGQNLEVYSSTQRVLRMTASQLKEAFGESIAQKIMAAEQGDSIEGEDLQIGGEGMKAFYDRNLVNITNGLIKKAGGKVGPVRVKGENAPAGVQTQTGLVASVEGREANKQQARDLIAALGETESPRYRSLVAALGELDALTDEEIATAVASGDTQPGFEITDALRDQASGGFPLFQKTGKPRGQIAMFSDKMVITLFADADMSTLLHETGHLFVEELARNATRAGAPAEIKADWAAIKKWLKGNGHPVRGSAIPREAHELLARGFERYLMEGRAPSKNLEGAFGTFRAWLIGVYKNVLALRSPITPEVREVFDRLLATQDAIDSYRAEQNAGPLFTDKPADMTQAEFAAYRESVLGSRDEALARLTKKVMEDVRKRANKSYRSRAKDVREDVVEELQTEPRFVALHLLRTGRWLGDGDKDNLPVKIDRQWFVSSYGAAALDRLPKGPFLVKNDGDDADFIAELTGFPSGAAMVEALFEIGDQQTEMRTSGDRRSVIDKETDDRVKAVLDADGSADALSPERIEEEAQAAIENEQQGALLSAELRYLSRGTRETPTPYRLARVWAERKVRAGTVQAVASRAAVQQYARAAAKSGRLAEEALIAGDSNEAYRQKQAQLINHALFAEAKLAADTVDLIVARMKRLGKRAAMKTIDQDYMDRVHGLLEGFDFRKKTAKFLTEQQGFADWAAGQAELGFEVQVPPRLALNGVPYTRASVEELYGLDDAVKGLLHLGKLKQGILDGIAEREYTALIDDMVAKLADLPDRKISTEINDDVRPVSSVLSFLVKIETLADDFDGGDPNGPFNRLLTQRANDMENHRAALRDQALKPISEAYLGLSAKHRKRLEEKLTIPQFLHKGGELDPRNGQPVTMTRMELLAVALNTGNLSNLEKMAKGEGWNAADIQAVLRAELTKEDWDFVQTVWDSIGSLWPDIAATERALSGVVPEQVEITPIDTPFGAYRGGYYPVVYDPDRSQRAENNATNEGNDLFGMKSGISTPKGHTITRTEASGPILRSVEAVLFSHIEKVITRVSYAEYVRDVLRVIDNPRVRNGIDLKLGREYRKQIRPWLQRVVNAASVDQRGLNWAERFLRAARVNMSLVAMGFRVSTGIAQIGGWNQSSGRIGARYLALGMKTLLRDRGDAVQFVFDRSPEMKRRNGEVNRDVADAMKMMRGKDGIVNKARVMAFWHIGMIDRYVVAVPTWLGAHAKGIGEGMTDKEASYYADKMVRTSQGNGAEKDLANWQSPNSEAMRSMTLFYTIFNVQLNAQWQATRDVKKGNYMKAAVLSAWFLMAAPLMDALVSGDMPDEEDDEDTWANWFFRNVFFNLFSGVPLVRDMSAYGERKMAGEYASIGTTPVLRAEDAIKKASNLAIKAAQGEDLPETWVKTAIETPGYFMGLPTGQAAATGQFLWDYSNGDTDPDGFAQWYRGLTKGKTEKEK